MSHLFSCCKVLSLVPDDSFVQCVWKVKVTLKSKAGNVPSIEMAKSSSHSFSTLTTLNSGNKVTDTDERLLSQNKGLFEQFE
eukprot:scaffold478_cov63-Cyclotella_meneghiniana.AAC.2